MRKKSLVGDISYLVTFYKPFQKYILRPMDAFHTALKRLHTTGYAARFRRPGPYPLAQSFYFDEKKGNTNEVLPFK